MSKRYRSFALLLVIVMLISLLAACASNSSSGNKDTTKPVAETTPKGTDNATTTPADTDKPKDKEPVEIKFWTISLSPNFDDYINGRIKKFEEQNKGVTVKWTDIPYGSMENKLLTSIAGGKSPDVVNLNTGMTMTLAGKNALVDLNKEATEEQRSIYFPDLYNSTKLGESVYAFPWYYGLSVFAYNKKIYEEAGLDPNKPPTTYEEMKQQAIIIKEKTGKYGFVPSYNPPSDFYFLGVPMISEDKKTIIINTPEALEWSKWNKDLYEKGIVPKESLAADANYVTDKYQSGKIATLITGAQFLNRVKTNAPDVYNNTLVAKMPTLKAGGNVQAGLMNVVVPTMSTHHTEAILFANFITNDESQLEFCKVVNILPSTKQAASDPFFTEAGTDPESQAKIITAQMASMSKDFSLGVKNEGEVLDPLWKGWKEMLNGKVSPEEMLKKAEAEMQKKLDEVNANE
ncbi:sugar ABC transporter substrate-binding protein [Paenibacillus baekrokdamisoli]|uniref:Sugar ABC transporter substrate-binding protein n=1 Tax=Paenibacillus baekrokdamisoli TaxID=1712516 RepID=A0A3G9ILA9_9BACL|nr:sugar ABC transporter substrate-binding protein [Paenibacillus baekrokdamisoli]MBB3067100.1 putative chitobiose transport system substrate-binding protein [Paenibacillus baekrokdamisoli]BBH19707.1 sugar ABC transporter substrate-binding protein [Paenibacillus baekrokdamisoli]